MCAITSSKTTSYVQVHIKALCFHFFLILRGCHSYPNPKLIFLFILEILFNLEGVRCIKSPCQADKARLSNPMRLSVWTQNVKE